MCQSVLQCRILIFTIKRGRWRFECRNVKLFFWIVYACDLECLHIFILKKTIFRCACKCSFHQWKGNGVRVLPMLCLSSLYFFNKIKCNMSRMILWFYLHCCLIIPCWCLYLLEFMSFIALRCWLQFKFNALYFFE